MDIVDFFSRLTEHFNTESKCDECWYFGAPLSEDAVNSQQSPREAACCVHVIVTDTSKDTAKGYNNTTSLLNSHVDDYSFTVLFVKQDDIGTNTYNETNGHPIEEGKWQTILRPLQECLCDTEVLDFCTLIGEHIQVTAWSMTLIKNYNNQRYTGWRVRGKFRKRII